MPNTREKLMRLLCTANSKATEAEAFEDATYAEQLGIQADHLISNGVTFAEDINVPSEWISVKDRLPEKYGRYLALTPNYRLGKTAYDPWLIYYHPGSGFYDADPEWGDIPMDDVTHWMPLPEAPKGE